MEIAGVGWQTRQTPVAILNVPQGSRKLDVAVTVSLPSGTR
jgi:hypothetical protein